jgi:ribonuclease D
LNIPTLITTDEGLRHYATQLAQGVGPVAIDAERASGFRYSQRAYLIQMKRQGTDLGLIDPIDMTDFTPLQEAIGSTEWILHAATQDLPCLRDIGLAPTTLFDTELAGRLLGHDRVNLAALLDSQLGITLVKGQGATDWSRRPLSAAQIQYAALDVEYLIPLRDRLYDALNEHDKWIFAEQEFASLVHFEPRPPGPEPWRRLSGIHQLKRPRDLAIARELWLTRDALAQERDIAPGRLINDRILVEWARNPPPTRHDLGTHHASTEADRWWTAIQRGLNLPEADLPTRSRTTGDAGPPKQWARKNPDAFARWESARTLLTERAEELKLPVENLIGPALVRSVAWEPPIDVPAALAELGARPWQVGIATPILEKALKATPTQVTDE